MKIIRSSRHSIKFLTEAKKQKLFEIMDDYAKVVNLFIDIFWENPTPKWGISKQIIDLVIERTWFSYRMRRVAAYEACALVYGELCQEKEKFTKPHHTGLRIHAYHEMARIEFSKKSKHFDAWIHLHSLGLKVSFDIPIKLHKHYHKLASKGRLMTSCIISRENVQLCFETKTEPKKEPKKIVAFDSGMTNMLVSNERDFFGTDLFKKIEKVTKKHHASKNQVTARRAIRHYMDEVIKEIMAKGYDFIILENLQGITHGRKKGSYFNKLLNGWQIGYLHNRLKQKCDENRVSYRTVPARNTSRTCPNCGHVDKENRKGEEFKCVKCGFTGHADHVAAINIYNRFFYLLPLGKFTSPFKSRT